MKISKLLFTIIVATLLAACAGNEAQETQSLTNTYWRNVKSGDWLIGFTEGHVIYDSQWWEIVSTDVQGDKYKLTASNGTSTINIKVKPTKEGKRRIAIGWSLGTVCEPITGATLPDYPTRDNRKEFKDNGYRMGDSVTIVGWLKGLSPDERKNIKNNFYVGFEDIFTEEYIPHFPRLDSLGRFSITLPLLNATQAYVGNTETVLEPGERYFYLHDFTTGQKLFMGEDVRLQNELATYPYSMVSKQMRMRSATEEQVMQFLKESDEEYRTCEQELQKRIEEHPRLSQRYIEYVNHSNRMSQGRNLLMVQFNLPEFRLPKEFLEYVTENIWERAHRHPYTLCSETERVIYYFTIQAENTHVNTKTDALPMIKRLADEGAIILTDKEIEAVERYPAMSDSVTALLKSIESSEEMQAVAKAFNSSEIVATISTLLNRAHNDVHAKITCDVALNILDSVKHTEAMRDIYLAKELYDFIDNIRLPLSPYMQEWLDNNVKMEAAKDFVMELNEKYLALQRKKLEDGSIKSSDIVKEMTDGEKILRTLIEPYKGKIILLDIWGTWCGPCKRALEKSQEEYEHLKEYDIVYLYLANRSDEESWKSVIKEYNVTGENVVHYNLPDKQQDAIERFLGVSSFPTYKLIDRGGNILDVNADPRDLEALKRLLKMIE